MSWTSARTCTLGPLTYSSQSVGPHWISIGLTSRSFSTSAVCRASVNPGGSAAASSTTTAGVPGEAELCTGLTDCSAWFDAGVSDLGVTGTNNASASFGDHALECAKSVLLCDRDELAARRISCILKHVVADELG